ncbi:MAG: flagellar hook-basal body complex protein [Bacteroidetes bacterium]|nr:flagellar hook-basal body complex protein [Bacteroidota bacterium]
MSLIKAMNSGVSGLRAFQTKMDVIGNNIANVETTGFKSSRTTFAELMTQRLGRSGQSGDSAPQLSNQIGLGVRVASIDRDFSQGVLNNTGVNTDVALEGEGFFSVKDESQTYLTRAGNFVFNKGGFLVDPAGRTVQGFLADRQGNVLRAGTTSDIYVDFENVFPPKSTEKVKLAGNLDSNTSKTQTLQSVSSLTTNAGQPARATTSLNDLAQVTTNLEPGDSINFQMTLHDGTARTVSFNYTAGATVQDLVNTFNTELTPEEGRMALQDGMLSVRSATMGDSSFRISNVEVTGSGVVSLPPFQVAQEGFTGNRIMSTSVYDDLGRPHSMLLEFRQIGDNLWEYEARFTDGQPVTQPATPPYPQVSFDELGNLLSGGTFNVTFEPGNGALATTFEVELGDLEQGISFTQYAGNNSAKVFRQDGYQQGALIDMQIDGEGRVQGVFDNGKSRVLAQLAVSQVQNQNGLEMMGAGLYRATFAAGEMFTNTASDFSGTSITAGALEASNVDLAKQFTEMITSQRAYQSSARVISVSDEMLLETVNLKR